MRKTFRLPSVNFRPEIDRRGPIPFPWGTETEIPRFRPPKAQRLQFGLKWRLREQLAVVLLLLTPLGAEGDFGKRVDVVRSSPPLELGVDAAGGGAGAGGAGR